MVTAILGMVAAAVVGVYRFSLETYTRAASLEDAQVGARAGLDRMATELRLIGAYWSGAGGAGAAITAASATTITFMSDVNGDTVSSGAETTVAAGTTATGTTVQVSGSASAAADAFDVYSSSALNDYVYVADGAIREVKQISGISGTTLTLASALATYYPAGSIVRSVETVTYNYDGSAQTLTRSVGGSGAQTIIDNVTGLTLTYFQADGVTTATGTADIREIQISLTTEGSDGSSRIMTSRVRPRNLL